MTVVKAMRPWLLTAIGMANDDDDECDQLNRSNDHEPDDNMSHDDDDDMVIAM